MKLVRDRVGDIPWPAPGREHLTAEQRDQFLGWVNTDILAYRQMLREKLREEVEELLVAHRAANSDDILDEAADVFEVLRALLVVQGVATPSTARQVLANAVDRKFVERGGFFQGRTWSGPERAGHPATSCCGGTGFADYAAVPCPNPQCTAVLRAGEMLPEVVGKAGEIPPTTPPAATQAGEAAPTVPKGAPNAPGGAQAVGRYSRPCPKCGSLEWVAISFTQGLTRFPQCVPCGRIHPTRLGPNDEDTNAPRDANGVPLKLKSNHQCRLCGRWLEGEWNNAHASGLAGLCEILQRQMDNGRCDPGHCLTGRISEAKHAPPRVVGPDLPTVWITVINDTRSGATPYAFTDRDEAIKYARKTAEECARKPEDIREEAYPDYAYYVRYSSESNAWVVGVRLNAEVPNG